MSILAPIRTERPRPAYRPYRATVAGVRRLSPHFTRVSFHCDDFEHFGTECLDQRIKLLFPLDQFKREMDEYARRVRQLKPFPGIDQALLPGAIEWERERRFSQEGIPVGTRHAETLKSLGEEYGVSWPVL